jgi:predicted fused transcriptional regulator/phosphomethylpyrimidine kinase
MTVLRDPSQTQKRVKLELNIAYSSKQVNSIENKHLTVQNLDRDCTV